MTRKDAIKYLFGEYNGKLYDCLFDNEESESLKNEPEVILKNTGWASGGERILIKVALDIWCDSNFLEFTDLRRLDDDNYRRVFKALRMY